MAVNETSPQRRFLTTRLLTTMSSICLTGDMIAPDGGGWDGPPEAPGRAFHGYCVLHPALGQHQTPTGSFLDPGSDWVMNYTLMHYQVSREACESQADQGRQALLDLTRLDILMASDLWHIQQVRVNTIGAVTRVDATVPPVFTQTDSMAIWISKEF